MKKSDAKMMDDKKAHKGPTIIIGIEMMKKKADERLNEIDKEEKAKEAKGEDEEGMAHEESEGLMEKAKSAIAKGDDITISDAADILLAAENIKKDKVLMKEVNALMKDKQAKMEKITSLDQLKAVANKMGAGE